MMSKENWPKFVDLQKSLGWNVLGLTIFVLQAPQSGVHFAGIDEFFSLFSESVSDEFPVCC